jgi:hypothetical protein
MRPGRLIRLAAILLLAGSAPVWAKTPDWLQELATAPLPRQEPEVEAVQLLRQVELTVTPDGKMRQRVRGAFRILRREGQRRAVLQLPQSTWSKVQEMHGWTIPASGKDGKVGKDLEVRSSDAIEVSATNVQGGELISDVRIKLLQIPNAEPGATVGFEYEISLNPLEMADTFNFQQTIPVREATYTLKLPPGWNMQAAWVNHATVETVPVGPQQWRWTLKDIPAVPVEAGMPAWESVAGHLVLAVSPPGKTSPLSTWTGIGSWFLDLSRDRRVASTDIRSSVAALIAGKTSELQKMRTLGAFVQREVRYVAITLGIGGYQPHAATEVFVNRYGDCKDKATLLAVMLAEAGIDSVPVIVNADRSEVRTDTPPRVSAFNHVILAIRLPRDLQDSSLLATFELDGTRWLIFDPTDELTPFGRIRGQLQGNVGLLALTDSSRLITLPQLEPGQAGTRRTARLALDEQGLLRGDVRERITGQDALTQRSFLRSSNRDSDTTKIVEARLAGSLASFQLTGATARNREASELPLEWDYRISAPSYARRTGELLVVRPRVVGVEAANLPGEGKPRVHDLLLVEPKVNQDEFVIDLPAGYVVESLPPPVEVDTGFAVYRSRTEVTGSQLRYTRSYEVRALTVPAARIADYRRLQSEIARDERAVAVLKKAAP